MAAGAPLDASDTSVVRVPSSDRSVLSGLLSPSGLSVGWVAAVAINAGEPVTLSELARPARGPSLGEMSIAVPIDEADGGRLVPGDHVDVIASNSTGSAHYVAQGLRVVAVAPSSATGALLSSSTGYYVVVAVGKQAALHIAAALGSQGPGGTGVGAVELVRSSGYQAASQVSYSLGAAHARRGRSRSLPSGSKVAG